MHLILPGWEMLCWSSAVFLISSLQLCNLRSAILTIFKLQTCDGSGNIFNLHLIRVMSSD